MAESISNRMIAHLCQLSASSSSRWSSAMSFGASAPKYLAYSWLPSKKRYKKRKHLQWQMYKSFFSMTDCPHSAVKRASMLRRLKIMMNCKIFKKTKGNNSQFRLETWKWASVKLLYDLFWNFKLNLEEKKLENHTPTPKSNSVSFLKFKEILKHWSTKFRTRLELRVW